MAITSVNPLRVYIYEEGLTRFATCKYNTSTHPSKANKFMHLTNFSVNKKNLNFVANDADNDDRRTSKWSITNLKKAMVEQGMDCNTIWAKIEDICIKTILSAEN